MAKFTRKSRIALLVLVCAAVGVTAGAVAIAATHHASHRKLHLPRARRASGIAAITPGPYPFTRANGLDPANAQPAGTSSVVGALKVVRGNGVACLLYSDGGDHCLSEELIDHGRDVDVQNNCSASSDHAMAIFGVAPAGTEKVTLQWSDGSTTSSGTVNGVYLFDGTTPQSGSAYPTAVLWQNASGSTLSSSKFPIGPSQFCPGS